MNAFAQDTQPSFLSTLLGASGLTSSLPTKQESVTYYIEAVVAFWVIGGITLWLVSRASK